VAATVALLSGCGHSSPSQAAALGARSDSGEFGGVTDPSATIGQRRDLGNGLSVTISSPKSFTPTDTAYPHSVRGIAFDLTIENNSSVAYRPSQLSITATADGDDVAQIIDSTQGYPGSVRAADDVAPGQSLHFAVAFAAPNKTVSLTVSVQPDAAVNTTVTLFSGSA
jgi:hypothetical protein